MDYMEAVKKLEEKLVLNQQKHENCGLVDGKCNGQVVASRIICYDLFSLKMIVVSVVNV